MKLRQSILIAVIALGTIGCGSRFAGTWQGTRTGGGQTMGGIQTSEQVTLVIQEGDNLELSGSYSGFSAGGQFSQFGSTGPSQGTLTGRATESGLVPQANITVTKSFGTSTMTCTYFGQLQFSDDTLTANLNSMNSGGGTGGTQTQCNEYGQSSMTLQRISNQ